MSDYSIHLNHSHSPHDAPCFEVPEWVQTALATITFIVALGSILWGSAELATGVGYIGTEAAAAMVVLGTGFCAACAIAFCVVQVKNCFSEPTTMQPDTETDQKVIDTPLQSETRTAQNVTYRTPTRTQPPLKSDYDLPPVVLTPLIHRIKKGNLEEVKRVFFQMNLRLVDRGLRAQVPKNALHHTAIQGNVEIAKFFINNGADPHEADQFGKTPLHYAAESGSCEMIRYLLDVHKVNINARDDFDQTPLHFAARKQKKEAIKLLCSYKDIDIHAQDDEGLIPKLIKF